MAVSHARSVRKVTGGRYRPYRKKRKYELGREYIPTKVGSKNKVKVIRVRGGNRKYVQLEAQYASVAIPKEKKVVKAKILSVVENPANHQYVRMNIITKGAILETDLGYVKVTSRPGQDGTVNAILLEDQENYGKKKKRR